MIRVFIIGVLALAALVLISGHLPIAESGDPMDGVWEGTLNTYTMQGDLVSSKRMRLQYAPEADGVRKVAISARRADGTVEEATGEIRDIEGRLERRLVDRRGEETLFAGTRAGAAIIWHGGDASSQARQAWREQIVRTPDGDLYTVDGVGVFGDGSARVELYEGRYRKSPAADR